MNENEGIFVKIKAVKFIIFSILGTVQSWFSFLYSFIFMFTILYLDKWKSNDYLITTQTLLMFSSYINCKFESDIYFYWFECIQIDLDLTDQV